MTPRAKNPRRRGEPLVVLGAIALGWITMRAFAWQPPFPIESDTGRTTATRIAVGAEADRTPAASSGSPIVTAGHLSSPSGHQPRPVGHPSPFGAPIAVPARLDLPQSRLSIASLPNGPTVFPPFEPASPRISPRAPKSAAAVPKRWHIDGWIAWRPGGAGPSGAPGQPIVLSYGASQAGMLARFDLASSPRRPQAYARVLHAPDRPSQSDLAVGLGARPLTAIPIRLQGEVRATRLQGEALLRPSVLAVTELAPVSLPFSLRAEGYAQAGWVGGRYATEFVDAQARIDRTVAAAGPLKIRLGAGAWGGAQKHAGRLDVGPTLTLDLREGAIPARLSLDYRHQVAGSVRPGSGVAVTLSTGF